MTPQELDLLCKMIGDSAKAGYMIGRDDQKAKKAENIQQFTVTPAQQLLIKKEINKKLKKR